MTPEHQEDVRILLDPKVDAPALAHARLPNPPRLVDDLGAQRRVLEIAQQETQGFISAALYIIGSFGELALEGVGTDDAHEFRS